MATEIERKFLLPKDFKYENLGYRTFIKQGYIFLAENKHLRVRLMGDVGYLALKYTETIVRDEFEYEIPLVDTLTMLSRCEDVVEKVRIRVFQMFGVEETDIDIYPNGLIVAEVEFKTKEEAEAFIPPTTFGKEITGNREYSNISLAKQKLHF